MFYAIYAAYAALKSLASRCYVTEKWMLEASYVAGSNYESSMLHIIAASP